MGIKKDPYKRRIIRSSMINSCKIALIYFAFGVLWILITDYIVSELFSNYTELVYFQTLKGLAYVLFSAIFILCVIYIHLKQIYRKNADEMQDKQQIENQRALLKALINVTTDLVFYKDAEFRYLGCNKAFEEFVGLTEAEIVGKTDYDLFDPKTADLFRQKDLEMINLGNSKINEEFVTYPDGHTVWLDTKKSPFYDSSSSLIGIVGVSRDISERKAMILRLEEEKKLFDTFINSSQDLIYIKDNDFRHLLANKALADFYNRDIGELIGKTDYELMEPENAEKCRETDQEAVNKNMTLSSIEKVNERIFETRKFPVIIDEGKTGIGGIVRDITTEYMQQETISNISETNRIIAQCMIKPFSNIQEQLDFALNEAIKLTGSQYGYIYFFDEDTGEFTLNSWTNGVMPDCTITEKLTKYQLDKTGIWGEVVRQRRSIIVNDFSLPDPLKKGYPMGHVNIRKFMSLPLFDNDKIVAVIGFANKKTNYTDNDVHSMSLLMMGVWNATRRKEKEYETERLLRQTQSMFSDHEAAMLIIDPDSGRILLANNAASKLLGYSIDELLKPTNNGINMINSAEARILRQKALQKEQEYFTVPSLTKNGTVKIVDIYISPVLYEGGTALFCIIFDVTKREETNRQIEYQAYHDYLTGLYNRRFFEEEFSRRNSGDYEGYPIAIMMGDVNGLKAYNDTFGHQEGDKALKDIVDRIQKHADSDDIVARIGGDEFAIIKFNTSRQEIEEYLDKLDKQVNYDDKNTEKGKLTISFGYSVQTKREDSLDGLMKEAEAFMYNRKYYSSMSARSNTVNVIMDALFTKSEREKDHSERVGLICKAIAEKMQIERSSIERIKVAGFLHDIGKIGIDEGVLNKDGKLDEDEWKIMKLHSAKGARILEHTVEFSDIADIVLFHHERFDGSGYPKGLKGEEIPLMSRIIAVADAYDAMTNTRSYRKAMSPEEAVEELSKYAGTQFDPDVVSVFISSLDDLESPIGNV